MRLIYGRPPEFGKCDHWERFGCVGSGCVKTSTVEPVRDGCVRRISAVLEMVTVYYVKSGCVGGKIWLCLKISGYVGRGLIVLGRSSYVKEALLCLFFKRRSGYGKAGLAMLGSVWLC